LVGKKVKMLPRPYTELSDLDLCALCIWRESRGEGILGKRGVAHVIKNRASEGFGYSISHVILKPYQFSSFNASDPNSDKWPGDADHSWLDCQQVAQDVLEGNDEDITAGATFYFSPPLVAAPHAWGPVEVVLKVGNLTFCKPVPPADLSAQGDV
jgi:spore germination cell wall hydrolase CwlJ-like protein